MPLGEAPLPQATIDAIRQWITNGAPNAPATAENSATETTAAAFAVAATAPVASSAAKAPVTQVVVAFTHAVDATLINDTTVSLERADPVGRAAHVVLAAVTPADHNPAVLVIKPFIPLAPGIYKVSLRGTGGGALADLAAHTLGADVSWRFSVTAAP
jgi:hypothetical protein